MNVKRKKIKWEWKLPKWSGRRRDDGVTLEEVLFKNIHARTRAREWQRNTSTSTTTSWKKYTLLHSNALVLPFAEENVPEERERERESGARFPNEAFDWLLHILIILYGNIIKEV